MPRKRLRILFDAHALLGQKTGVGYYTDRLIRELARQHPDDIELIGYYHNFLYRKKTPGLPTAPNIRYRRIAFMPGQIVNLLRRFHILLPVELLTLTKADFIFYPNYLGLSSLFRIPSASVIHDLTFVDLPDYLSKRNLYDLRTFIPAQIARSSFLVTVSNFSKQRICEEFSFPPKQVLVTPVPPEGPRHVDINTKQSALSKLGITGKYILTLGTIEPRKNLPNMLDAYLQLPEKVQQAYTFVIAGKIGWNCELEVARLKQAKVEGKNILHLGYVSDLERAILYESATLFTWASYYEGFGMPILEAMEYGVPCAISDIAVFKEVADTAALYFDQQQPTSIAAVWKQLLTEPDERKRLGTLGKQRSQTYRWDDVTTSFYRRVVKTVRAKL